MQSDSLNFVPFSTAALPVADNGVAIDQLSGGRVEIGIGCGRYGDQAMADALDMPPGERISRLAEGADVLNRLLSGDTAPFVGRFTRYDHSPLPRTVCSIEQEHLGALSCQRRLDAGRRPADVAK
jgi:alkanesulfonate monooxygenase SsuD/methylene tetrahydromethanopterin reductase-like flavin-dependent oxidoreductase (luciferase family)